MKKQFIFLMTDTTRVDMLGCYGNKAMYTPNLDKLASEGLRYDKAYTTQPVCSPARSAIFTGTYPHRNGMIANSLALRVGIKSIGEYLTDGGIEAAYIGKWHLDGGDYFGNGKCPPGWDDAYWYDMHCYLDELSTEERRASRLPETSFGNWPKEKCFAHRCVDRALSFIERHEDDDYLLVISLDEPHWPSVCPEPFNTLYEGYEFEDSPAFHDDLSGKPLYQKLWASAFPGAQALRKSSVQNSLFLGSNSFADYEFGRVIDKINESNPDALILFTSDHGDMCGAHGLKGKSIGFYRETCNIPLIIKNGRTSERGVVAYPTSHVDLAPTVLEYFGIDIPHVMQGESILPQLYDPLIKIRENVFTEFTRVDICNDGFGGLQFMRAIYDGRYKLVLNLMDSDELYDTESDPYEVCNLIADDRYWKTRNKLHDALIRQMDESRDPYRGYQWKVRPWRMGECPSWKNSGAIRYSDYSDSDEPQLSYFTGLPVEK